MLRICALADVRIQRDGQDVELAPRTRQLLSVFLLAPQRSWTTDALADRLWMGAPPDTASSALRVHLSKLRSATLSSRTQTPRLIRRGGAYVLHLEPGEFDVAEAEDAVRIGQRLGSVEAIEKLRDLLRIWHSESFQGIDQLEGVAERRGALHILRGEAATLVAEFDVANGNHQAVLVDTAAQLEHHPTNDRLVAAMALATYRSGDHRGALSLLRSHTERLVDEWGLDPSNRLRVLETAMLRHDVELELPAARQQPQPGQPRTPDGLIGRDHELQELVCAATSPDRGQLLLVFGEAGIGKTTLLAAAVDVTSERGVRPILVHARPTASPLDVVSQLLSATGEPPAVGIDHSDLAVELASRLDRVPTTVSIDNLDYTDADSAAVLRITSGLCKHVCWIVSSRRSDPERLDIFQTHQLLANLRRLQVPPLSMEAAVTLAEHHLALSSAGALDPHALAKHAGGNPFLVCSLSRNAQVFDPHVVPPGVEEFLRRAMRQLDGPVKAMIEFAALDTEPVLDVPVLSHAARAASSIGTGEQTDVGTLSFGESDDRISDGIGQAVMLGVLGEGPDGLVFRHDLARHAVVAGIVAPRRRAIHRVLGHSLIQWFGDSQPGRIAHHFRATEESSSLVNAAEWTAKEARFSLAGGASIHAAESFVLAASLGERAGLSRATTLGWQLESSGALVFSGDFLRSQQIADEVGESARNAQLSELFAASAIQSVGPWLALGPERVRTVNDLTEAWAWLGPDHPMSIRLAEAAVRATAVADGPAERRLEEDVRSTLERASESRDGEQSTLANLGLRILSWKDRGTPVHRLRVSRNAAGTARRASTAATQLTALRALTTDLLAVGNEECEDCADAYRSEAQRFCSAYHTWDAHRIRATIAATRGDDDRAKKHIAEADLLVPAVAAASTIMADLSTLFAKHARQGALGDLYAAVARPDTFDESLDPSFDLASMAIASQAGQPVDVGHLRSAVERVLFGAARHVAFSFAAIAVDGNTGPEYRPLVNELIEGLLPASGSLCLVEGGLGLSWADRHSPRSALPASR